MQQCTIWIRSFMETNHTGYKTKRALYLREHLECVIFKYNYYFFKCHTFKRNTWIFHTFTVKHVLVHVCSSTSPQLWELEGTISIKTNRRKREDWQGKKITHDRQSSNRQQDGMIFKWLSLISFHKRRVDARKAVVEFHMNSLLRCRRLWHYDITVLLLFAMFIC